MPMLYLCMKLYEYCVFYSNYAHAVYNDILMINFRVVRLVFESSHFATSTERLLTKFEVCGMLCCCLDLSPFHWTLGLMINYGEAFLHDQVQIIHLTGVLSMTPNFRDRINAHKIETLRSMLHVV